MIRGGKARDEIKKTSHILGVKHKCIMRHVVKRRFFNGQLCGFFFEHLKNTYDPNY